MKRYIPVFLFKYFRNIVKIMDFPRLDVFLTFFKNIYEAHNNFVLLNQNFGHSFKIIQNKERNCTLKLITF